MVDLDYANNYVHSGTLHVTYISKEENATQGYPRLQKLKDLKKDQILKHAITPCGARVRSQDIVSTLHTWIHEYNLQFDVVMIGALVDNQFIRPILEQLPLHRLCAKPGFLFVWATSRKIQELSKIITRETIATVTRIACLRTNSGTAGCVSPEPSEGPPTTI